MVQPVQHRHRGVAPRHRKVRILATLGPASSGVEMIRKLFIAGADAFRINMSHGDHAMHAANIAAIRSLEKELGRPTTILADLQGPKLRVGTFAAPPVMLETGARFVIDSDPTPGDASRVQLPHPEILGALEPGARLLIDDGKLVLRVAACHDGLVETVVEVGGHISDRKGLNLPDIVVPLAALTEKDRRDLTFALDQNVDWIALSFVQRPEDVAEARTLIRGKAGVLVKFEKPQGLARLEEILELADACMVARGDLGVELPPEAVPPAQKRIVATARAMGKPVVVATQMLESMITSPSPTRAEVSDVATAVYDGADAVMLSAETAAGAWPVEAVTMMDRIAQSVEADPGYRDRVQFTQTKADPTTADALSEAAGDVAQTIGADAILCFTFSGSTARRISRERPAAPLLVLTPKLEAARRMGLLWGVHAVRTRDIGSFEEMIDKGKRMALRHGIGRPGSKLVMMAGVPFGTPGSTNVLHVAQLTGDELKGYRGQGQLIPADAFTVTFTASPEHIDELGHVNNAVWVQWIQHVSTSHWAARASAAEQAAYIWVIVRHEIDYHRPLLVGECVVGHTWVAEEAKGAKFDRNIVFAGADGRKHVSAVTTWALLNRASGRPLRVPPELVGRFS